jgi:hypothetical protein
MLTLLASVLLARPLVMAHYMPWYESKPVSGTWGWHWTMNHFDPDRPDAEGRQPLASRFRPIIGAYDSSDPDLLECQTLEMKLSGIDGVLIDWYGTKDLYDYTLLNRNAQKMIEACSKAGLKFSIVLEDQVVTQLVKSGKSSAQEFGRSALDWLKARWFGLPGYLRWNGKPVLLIFGPQYYKDAELEDLFGHGLALFTLLGKRGPAVGAYGWPEPQVGNDRSWTQLRSFYDRAKQWPASLGVAYPRFEDIYKQAGVGPGWGEILDDGGMTFEKTLSLAEESHAPFIQIATWNDWGEGTQVEPSVEFGYRDLELLQKHRRLSEPAFSFRPADLRLPARLYHLRKSGASRSKLEKAYTALLAGRVSQAIEVLDSLSAARQQ